ncbi:MAG: LapA family protein [Novosphingobium sp.]|jgi:putative membrane protein|nr:LapA family protein [Novosphingobium sp.]
MQIIRTLIWVTITAILVGFIAMNWESAPVNIWPLEEGYLYFRWPVGVIALVFFALGLLPMWLLHRAGRWRWERRIHSLENSVRAAANVQAPPLATSTQLEAEAQEKPAD